jgi:hypothetical protein
MVNQVRNTTPARFLTSQVNNSSQLDPVSQASNQKLLVVISGY